MEPVFAHDGDNERVDTFMRFTTQYRTRVFLTVPRDNSIATFARDRRSQSHHSQSRGRLPPRYLLVAYSIGQKNVYRIWSYKPPSPRPVLCWCDTEHNLSLLNAVSASLWAMIHDQRLLGCRHFDKGVPYPFFSRFSLALSLSHAFFVLLTEKGSHYIVPVL